MIRSSETQIRTHEYNSALSPVFLMMAQCQHWGKVGTMQLFYDCVSQHLIGIDENKLNKQELLNNVACVRGGRCRTERA